MLLSWQIRKYCFYKKHGCIPDVDLVLINKWYTAEVQLKIAGKFDFHKLLKFPKEMFHPKSSFRCLFST